MSTSFPSLSDLYRAVGTSLDTLRRSISGGDATTRALLAFTGLTTGGQSIQTPWGQLRPLAEHERKAAPSMLDGAVSGTDSGGNNVTVAHAGELELDTELPFMVTRAPMEARR